MWFSVSDGKRFVGLYGSDKQLITFYNVGYKKWCGKNCDLIITHGVDISNEPENMEDLERIVFDLIEGSKCLWSLEDGDSSWVLGPGLGLGLTHWRKWVAHSGGSELFDIGAQLGRKGGSINEGRERECESEAFYFFEVSFYFLFGLFFDFLYKLLLLKKNFLIRISTFKKLKIPKSKWHHFGTLYGNWANRSGQND